MVTDGTDSLVLQETRKTTVSLSRRGNDSCSYGLQWNLGRGSFLLFFCAFLHLTISLPLHLFPLGPCQSLALLSFPVQLVPSFPLDPCILNPLLPLGFLLLFIQLAGPPLDPLPPRTLLLFIMLPLLTLLAFLLLLGLTLFLSTMLKTEGSALGPLGMASSRCKLLMSCKMEGERRIVKSQSSSSSALLPSSPSCSTEKQIKIRFSTKRATPRDHLR